MERKFIAVIVVAILVAVGLIGYVTFFTTGSCTASPTSTTSGNWVSVSCSGLPPNMEWEIIVYNNSTSSSVATLLPGSNTTSSGTLATSVQTNSKMVGTDTLLVYVPPPFGKNFLTVEPQGNPSIIVSSPTSTTTTTTTAGATTTSSTTQSANNNGGGASTTMTTASTSCVGAACTGYVPTPICDTCIPSYAAQHALIWAQSNQTVSSSVYNQQISLPSTNIQSVTSTIPIAWIAYNASVVQIELTQNSTVQLTLASNIPPSAVYADNHAVSSWTFSNGQLTIQADPQTLTLVYGSPSGTTSSPSYLSMIEGFFLHYMLYILAAVIVILPLAAFAINKR